LEADFAGWSFTAGDSFAGWEADAGAAADEEDGEDGEDWAGEAAADAASAGCAGGGSALSADAFAAEASCSWATGELSELFGGVVVDVSEELEGESVLEEDSGGAEGSAFTVWVEKYSAQLGSTLEGSSRHCSRSASTSH
jgi:hypothetical protein